MPDPNSPSRTLPLVDPVSGDFFDIPESDAPYYLDRGWKSQTAADVGAAALQGAREIDYGGIAGAAKAGLAAGVRGATLGASDVAARLIGGGETADTLRNLREAHPGLSTGAEVAGAILPALLSGGETLPASLAARAGRGVAEAAGGGVRGALAGGVVEGGLFGVGQGVSESALSQDLTLEHAAAAIGSNALYGAAAGGLASGAVKGVEAGLGAAKRALDRALIARSEARAMGAVGELEAEAATAPGAVTAETDPGTLDRAGLKAAREQELEAAHAAQVPERQAFVDDLRTSREAMKEEKPWIATANGKTREVREIGKLTLEADRRIDGLLKVEQDLVDKPQKALSALRQQEQALGKLQEWGERETQRYLDEVAGARDKIRGELLENKVPGYRFGKGAISRESPVVDDLVEGIFKERYPHAGTPPAADATDILSKHNAEVGIDFKPGRKSMPDSVNLRIRVPGAASIADEGESGIVTMHRGSDGRFYVEDTRLSKELRGKRLGMAMYERLNDHMEEKYGQPVISDLATHRSSDGEALWRRLEQRGLARRLGPDVGDRPERWVMLARAERPAAAVSDHSGPRLPTNLQVLNAVPGALERNRALQDRLAKLAESPTSPRLTAIDAAEETLGVRTAPPKPEAAGSPIADVLRVAAHAVPFGGVAERAMGALGGLRKAVGAGAERVGRAASTFLGKATPVVGKAAAVAPPVATKVLAALRYGEPDTDERGRPIAKPESKTLPELYRARTDEIKSQVQLAPDGTYQMRPAARAKMAARLSGLGVVDPIAADRLESAGAARIAWLASQLPRRPDLAGLPAGPDTWNPSDAAMRTWTRKAAAAEDPYGVLERASAGSKARVVPEEIMALRALQPALLNDYITKIITGLPDRKERLPYAQRLSLSMLTGRPLDPAMTPIVIREIQSMHAGEPGTAGGTMAPRSKPQFGSVKRSDPGTPAQRRQGVGL